MAIIKDRKKFKRTKEQTYPTNPTGNIDQLTDHFDIDKTTIKKQHHICCSIFLAGFNLFVL